jgi:hypothetical protein
MPFCLRARLQPCRKRRICNTALAAEGRLWTCKCIFQQAPRSTLAGMDANEDLQNLKMFVAAAEEEIKNLGIMKRAERRYPFDSVAEEVISKAFALVRSVMILIENDQPEEAYGLARSVVECALNLRWITAEPDLVQARAFKFVRYGLAVKNLWYWWVKKRYPVGQTTDDADEYAAAWNIIADGTGAFRHWSGEKQFTRTASELKHPLDAYELTSEDHAAKRAIEYFNPSCFVHCSQPGVDSYFSERTPFEIHRHKADPRNFSQLASFISNTCLHELIAYATYGMNVYLPSPLDCLVKHRFRDDIGEYRLEV